MKRTRILSFLLALVMVLSLVPGMTSTANAAVMTHSRFYGQKTSGTTSFKYTAVKWDTETYKPLRDTNGEWITYTETCTVEVGYAFRDYRAGSASCKHGRPHIGKIS